MEDWKERVIAEHTELTNKYVALDEFIRSDCFDDLNKESRELLICQKYAMMQYASVLSERIVLF